MSLPRRNEMAVIAGAAPGTISFLSVPLTPARRARLDALMVSSPDFDPVAVILDFLDDEIFSTRRPCAPASADASARGDTSSAAPSESADEPSIGGSL